MKEMKKKMKTMKCKQECPRKKKVISHWLSFQSSTMNTRRRKRSLILETKKRLMISSMAKRKRLMSKLNIERLSTIILEPSKLELKTNFLRQATHLPSKLTSGLNYMPKECTLRVARAFKKLLLSCSELKKTQLGRINCV